MTVVGTAVAALSVVLLAVGAVFVLGGTVGLVRLPDLYARAHAASKCDTVGACSILLALALQGDLAFGDGKVLLLALLILATGPTTAHALARASYRMRAPPAPTEDGRRAP
jgi:multicomponent Na+:H+ antiporter subunit G